MKMRVTCVRVRTILVCVALVAFISIYHSLTTLVSESYVAEKHLPWQETRLQEAESDDKEQLKFVKRVGGKEEALKSNNRVDDLDVTHLNQPGRISNSKELLILHESLLRAWRFSRGAKASFEIRKSIALTEKLLGSALIGIKPVKDIKSRSEYICPEEYKGSTYGYPYFHHGFEISNCAITKKLSSFLSLLLDFTNDDLAVIDRVMKGIRANYTDIPVYAAWASENNDIITKYPDVVFVTYNKATQEGSRWNHLIKKANTEFVLIGRNIQLFDGFDARVERLIRIIDDVDVKIVAGARRNMKDGLWFNGCYQSAVKNYTLSYVDGYDTSVSECLYCDYAVGPFVARRSYLQSLSFADELSGDILFRDLFLRLQFSGESALVCPDAMFYTKSLSEQMDNTREAWIPLVRRHKINRVRLNAQTSHLYTCDEIGVSCSKHTGIALPPCCLKHLADAINIFMRICEESNIICELQDGTVLGAMKFNKILPWERDADLTFLTSNFSTLAKLKDKFKQFGISAMFDSHALWCCADGIQAGGKGMLYYKQWHLELYGQHRMDTELLRKGGLAATRVDFDGYIVNVPRNPGLFARNRYGRMMYGHAQHWMTIGGPSGWMDYKPYKFTKCHDKKSTACLDQYFADGNIQFQDVIP